MAWVSACDIDDARTELQKYYGIKEAVNVIGLQWWLPNNSGNIKFSDDFDTSDTTIMPPDDDAVEWFRTFADQNGIKLYLCLYNCVDNNGTPFWDWALAKSAFATYPSQTITSMVNEMERLKLDGIDVDLESPYAAAGDKNAYIQFITSLSTAVHNKGKKLSVCTYASNQFSPGTDWWSSLSGKVDQVMCMAYEWAGVSGQITYASLASAASSAGLGSGVMCIGANADLNDNWQGGDARTQLNGIKNISNVGFCVWTCAIKGGGQWRETETWDIVKAISGKTVTVDTATPSPNLVTGLTFMGNTDPSSKSEVSVAGGILTVKLTQAGSVDNGFWANVIGHCANDFKDVKWVKITYTSTKPVTLQLYQMDLDTMGECFREALPAATSYTTKVLNVGTFFQPWWAKSFKKLDLSKVKGITFDPELEGMGNTTITVKELVCYGRSTWNITPVIESGKIVSSVGNYFVSLCEDALKYTVPADGSYAIDIYRINGSRVRSFVTGKISKGAYSIGNVAQGLSPGIYYTRICGDPGAMTTAITIQGE
jgi:hypothetical protein